MAADYVAGVDNGLGQPSQIVKRRVFESYQPTVMGRSGFHGLPPVHVRMPISDQYALGLIHPQTDFAQADPVTWTGTTNGSASPANGPAERAALRGSLREQIAQRRRDSWHVVDNGQDGIGLPTLPGAARAS